MCAVKPNRSRNGPGSSPDLVVAPTKVNGDRSRGMDIAPALADHDVDPEVLHGHVEHLLGRPGQPMDLIDEQHFAGLQGGEDRRQVPRG